MTPIALLTLLLAARPAPPAPATPAPPVIAPDEFWAHWGDNRAEVNGYRLTQPRDGAKRPGNAVLIFVTEDMSDALRVKADPGRHPEEDVFSVMKVNAIRDIQVGIYDYNVMTSTFSRVAPGWPVAKVSFSSQDWIGNLYHQLVIRGGQIDGAFHSYHDGEADGIDDLVLLPDGVLEDQLPILLRGWQGAYLKPGDSRFVAFLPSLMRTRLDRRPLAWVRAKIAREALVRWVKVPAGTFGVSTWTVAEDGGRTTTFMIESRKPYRVIRWATDHGEEAVLTGSLRLPYWKLTGPLGESYLRQLGLPQPGTP